MLAINGKDPFDAVNANALIVGSFQGLGTRQNSCVSLFHSFSFSCLSLSLVLVPVTVSIVVYWCFCLLTCGMIVMQVLLELQPRRERVELLHGELRADVAPARGFRDGQDPAGGE